MDKDTKIKELEAVIVKLRQRSVRDIALVKAWIKKSDQHEAELEKEITGNERLKNCPMVLLEAMFNLTDARLKLKKISKAVKKGKCGCYAIDDIHDEECVIALLTPILERNK